MNDAPGVPIITSENAEEVAANGCARSTVKETYEFILGDLNKAIELLANTKKTRSDKRYVSLDVAYGITCSCSPDICTIMQMH